MTIEFKIPDDRKTVAPGAGGGGKCDAPGEPHPGRQRTQPPAQLCPHDVRPMRELSEQNLDASLRQGAAGYKWRSARKSGEKTTHGKSALVHMIEMLSWGDAGVYLCIPSSTLTARPSRPWAHRFKERFLRRFSEGEPKSGAMAMTETQAQLQPATFSPRRSSTRRPMSGFSTARKSSAPAANWPTQIRRADRGLGYGGQSRGPGWDETLCGRSGHAGAEDRQGGRKKLGVPASDTVSFVLENCRVPAGNVLGDSEVKIGGGTKGFKGAMRTFDATRPIVAAASAIGIGRAAFKLPGHPGQAGRQGAGLQSPAGSSPPPRPISWTWKSSCARPGCSP